LKRTDKMDRETFILSQASIIDNQIYHFTSNPKSNPDHFQVNITDLHLNTVIKSFFKTNFDHYSRGGFYHAFGQYNDNITLHLPYHQHLYSINSDSIWKIFEINFQEWQMPEELFREFLLERNFLTQQDAVEMNKKIQNYALVKDIIPLKDRIFISFTYQFQPHGLLLNLENNNVNIFRRFFDGIPLSHLIGFNRENNILYFAIAPRYLKDISERDLSLVRNISDIEKLITQNDDLTKLNPWILKLQL